MAKVFVFGSNSTGFHGAGSAGYAMRGDSRNTWRQDAAFLKAMKAPEGHPDRIGKLAVFGIAEGFQTGLEGSSYAIVTVTRPGLRRSIPITKIREQLVTLWRFADTHPEYEFEMTLLGCGYAGYRAIEMLGVIRSIIAEFGLPDNILNSNCYSEG